MKRNKLVLKSETIRTLRASSLARAKGGATGPPCEATQAKTACDLAGCNFVCTEGSCDACDSQNLSCQGNNCTTP